MNKMQFLLPLGSLRKWMKIMPKIGSLSFILLIFKMLLANSIYSQCEFTISSETVVSGCFETVEEVVWTDLVNSTAINNDLQKTSGGTGWNGGAASVQAIGYGGSAYTVVNETNRRRYFGLSVSNTNASNNSIRHAFYLNNNGVLRIYENGASRGNFGSYQSGDTLRILNSVEGVEFYQNEELLYVSNLTQEPSLIVDVSFRDLNGTLEDVHVVKRTRGIFESSVTNAGTSPTYSWFLNGTPVGTNSPTYTNTSISDSDVITCTLTPGSGACSVSDQFSNSLTIRTASAPANEELYISANPVTTGCFSSLETVVWDESESVNIGLSSGILTKIQGGSNWNSGSASVNRVHDNGYFEFIATETNRRRFVGLSSSNSGSNQNSINYAFYLDNNSNLRIYESGNNRGNFGPYATGDTLRISVENGVVNYYQNSNLIRIAPSAPTLPMLVDVSIRDVNGTVSTGVISNFNGGGFTASSENAGSNPSYQWYLNGVQVGTNSPNYTNTSLNSGDLVWCEFSPDLGGCSSTTYLSDTISLTEETESESISFYITGTVAASACQQAVEEVVWNNDDLINVDASGNDLIKVQGGSSWNGGAASLNTVADNGYFEFIATETNRRRFVGLSSSNTGSNQSSINYSFYLENNTNLRIYENGANRGLFGSYTTGDTLRISVESGVVNYYRNGNLLRIAPANPTLPLLVDVSIRDVGGTVSNAIISNYNEGGFVANAENAGVSPSYQWFLNGSPVGSNSPSYTNSALSSGDVITCQLTPDLAACSLVDFTSNAIELFE